MSNSTSDITRESPLRALSSSQPGMATALSRNHPIKDGAPPSDAFDADIIFNPNKKTSRDNGGNLNEQAGIAVKTLSESTLQKGSALLRGDASNAFATVAKPEVAQISLRVSQSVDANYSSEAQVATGVPSSREAPGREVPSLPVAGRSAALSIQEPKLNVPKLERHTARRNLADENVSIIQTPQGFRENNTGSSLWALLAHDDSERFMKEQDDEDDEKTAGWRMHVASDPSMSYSKTPRRFPRPHLPRTASIIVDISDSPPSSPGVGTNPATKPSGLASLPGSPLRASAEVLSTTSMLASNQSKNGRKRKFARRASFDDPPNSLGRL
jgi:hypothetical protein